ncbi:MAG: molybdopterin-dependent oxidoreductase [Microbacteriaceae bacterium]
MRLVGIALVVIGTGMLLGGCGALEPEAVSESSEAAESQYGGFPIDQPALDEVVLSVIGADTRDFTYGELQELAQAEIVIVEPFVSTEYSFRGIPLESLFVDAGFAPSDVIETVALNDYRYSATVESWIDGSAILAVYRDGQPIPMDEGGPIRIVFPSDSGFFDNLDAWNWSLRAIVLLAD